jgi:cytochrome c oxidase subunit 2
VAASIANLWWLMLGLGTIIYLGTMGYLLWALFRRRAAREPDINPGQENRLVLLAGGALPAVVIVSLFGLTLGTLRDISQATAGEPVVISVVGHQWWWEVSYDQVEVHTANEIHIPVGHPVEFRLTSDDVIHSFWVPQLHSKLDLNPGRVTTFRLVADQAGEYWAECAEFCGVQHALMKLLVVAEPLEDFQAWLAHQSQPAAAPADQAAQDGLDVFLSANCIYCHTIEGTNATGALGPDLTHVASRRTLGAGTLNNTRGNLGGWVADPHSVKPGVLMPPSDLTGGELNSLLHYLATLE